MAVPKQTLRMVITQNSYRLANRLKQVLVLADYQASNIFEAIEANELLETLRQASPVHMAMLTPAIVSGLERTGLHEVLLKEFPDVALLYLPGEDGQEQHSRTQLIPDHVLEPPVTAESFDEAIATALESRENRQLAAEYIAQGEAAMKQGLLQEAQTKFEAAVGLGGQDPYASYALGELFNTMGDTEQAIVYFMQAWERAPSFVVAVHRVVELLFARGERSRAIPYLERVAQQASAPGESLVLLGTLYIESGMVDKGKATVQRACRAGMSQAIASIQEQVRSLLEQQHLEEAITLLQIGIEAQPENAHLYRILGDLHMKQDRHREALVCYDHLTRLGDPTPANYCRLARAYMALGFNLRAEKAVQEALDLDPECAEAAELRIAVAS